MVIHFVPSLFPSWAVTVAEIKALNFHFNNLSSDENVIRCVHSKVCINVWIGYSGAIEYMPFLFFQLNPYPERALPLRSRHHPMISLRTCHHALHASRSSLIPKSPTLVVIFAFTLSICLSLSPSPPCVRCIGAQSFNLPLGCRTLLSWISSSLSSMRMATQRSTSPNF